MALPWFHCFLGGGPGATRVPAPSGPGRNRVRAARGRASEPLVVHPRFWYQLGSAIPPELLHRAAFRGRFLPGYPLAWTEEPGTQVLSPHWVPREWALALTQLRAGAPPPPDVKGRLAEVLRESGLLVSAAEWRARHARWRRRLAEARKHLARHHYAVLPGLLSGAQLEAVRAYYRQLIASGALRLGDPQCQRRYGQHNEPLARFFLHQLTSVVELAAGEPLRAAYTYFAGYQSAATLEKHVDREQCEYSVTLLVDAVPEPQGVSSWPLFLETGEGEVAIHQAPGDALVYRGRRLPHRRDALPEGHASTSLLFHYVQRGFTGPLR